MELGHTVGDVPPSFDWFALVLGPASRCHEEINRQMTLSPPIISVIFRNFLLARHCSHADSSSVGYKQKFLVALVSTGG